MLLKNFLSSKAKQTCENNYEMICFGESKLIKWLYYEQNPRWHDQKTTTTNWNIFAYLNFQVKARTPVVCCLTILGAHICIPTTIIRRPAKICCFGLVEVAQVCKLLFPSIYLAFLLKVQQ